VLPCGNIGMLKKRRQPGSNPGLANHREGEGIDERRAVR
jgi:hypothetical protein